MAFPLEPIQGPFLMTLFTGAAVACLRTDINMDHFVFAPVVHRDVRSFARLMAGFFGSSAVLYLPDDIDPACSAADDALRDGWTLEQTVECLSASEAPASCFEDLILISSSGPCWTWSATGWYLEKLS